MLDLDYGLPERRDHHCPKCGKHCAYYSDRPTHKCPWCLEMHTVSIAETNAYDYIHSPTNIEPEIDEEMLACVIVAEAHAYSKRLRIAYGNPRSRQGNYRRDMYGNLSLLFTFDEDQLFETLPSRIGEWDAQFRQVWGVYEQHKARGEAYEIEQAARLATDNDKADSDWLRIFKKAWNAAERQQKKGNDAA